LKDGAHFAAPILACELAAQQKINGLADEIGDGGVARSGEKAEGLVAVRVEVNLESCLHCGIILQSVITEKSKRGKASLVPEAWTSCRRGQEKGNFVSVNSASGETVPKGMQARYDEILGIVDAFCAEHLNEEYAVLCRRMAVTLARKRPSPLISGKALSWASGIVYAIGRVNFLFDKSQKPHLMASELCALFGVSENTASGKSRTIMDMLKIMQMEPHWCLPSKLAENPVAWMIMVNGYVIDVRHASREIQEEAYRRGIIPFLPDTHGG
jgi:hypothetical protein